MPASPGKASTAAERGELVARVAALLLAGGVAAFGVLVLASWVGSPLPVAAGLAAAAFGVIGWRLFGPSRARAASAAPRPAGDAASGPTGRDATIPGAATAAIGPEEVTVGESPLVGIIMGSQSDMAVMEECAKTLESFGVPYELVVASAHRQPAKVHEWAAGAADRGLKVIIAAAGKAAHLGGVVAAMTTLPVITVPMKTSDLGGMDSLLSMVQMPSGVPVACVAINGAKNAAILATQVLGTSLPAYRDAIARMKAELAEG